MPPYETDESGVNRARASARSPPLTTAVAAPWDRFERKRHLRPAFAASFSDSDETERRGTPVTRIVTMARAAWRFRVDYHDTFRLRAKLAFVLPQE